MLSGEAAVVAVAVAAATATAAGVVAVAAGAAAAEVHSLAYQMRHYAEQTSTDVAAWQDSTVVAARALDRLEMEVEAHLAHHCLSGLPDSVAGQKLPDEE